MSHAPADERSQDTELASEILSCMLHTHNYPVVSILCDANASGAWLEEPGGVCFADIRGREIRTTKSLFPEKIPAVQASSKAAVSCFA